MAADNLGRNNGNDNTGQQFAAALLQALPNAKPIKVQQTPEFEQKQQELINAVNLVEKKIGSTSTDQVELLEKILAEIKAMNIARASRVTENTSSGLPRGTTSGSSIGDPEESLSRGVSSSVNAAIGNTPGIVSSTKPTVANVANGVGVSDVQHTISGSSIDTNDLVSAINQKMSNIVLVNSGGAGGGNVNNAVAAAAGGGSGNGGALNIAAAAAGGAAGGNSFVKSLGIANIATLVMASIGYGLADAMETFVANTGVELRGIFDGLIAEEFAFVTQMKKTVNVARQYGTELENMNNDYIKFGKVVDEIGFNRSKYLLAWREESKKGLSYEMKAGKIQQRIAKDQQRLLKNTLSMAYQLDMEAGSTVEIFSTWQRKLNMTNTALFSLGNTLRDVARTTGLTGENLADVVKSAEKTSEALKKGANLSHDTMASMIRSAGIAKQLGIEEISAEFDAGISSFKNWSEMTNDGLKGFIARALSATNQMGLLHSGLAASEDFRPDVAKAGMEEIGRGAELMGLDPKDLANMTGQVDEIRMEMRRAMQDGNDVLAGNLSAKIISIENLSQKLFGGSLNDVQKMYLKQYEESKDFGERLGDLNKQLNAAQTDARKEVLKNDIGELQRSINSSLLATFHQTANMTGKTLDDALKNVKTRMIDQGLMNANDPIGIQTIRKAVMDNISSLDMKANTLGRDFGSLLDTSGFASPEALADAMISADADTRQRAQTALESISNSLGAEGSREGNAVEEILTGVKNINELLRGWSNSFIMTLSASALAAIIAGALALKTGAAVIGSVQTYRGLSKFFGGAGGAAATTRGGVSAAATTGQYSAFAPHINVPPSPSGVSPNGGNTMKRSIAKGIGRTKTYVREGLSKGKDALSPLVNYGKDIFSKFYSMAKDGWSIFAKGYGRGRSQGATRASAIVRGSSGLVNSIRHGDIFKNMVKMIESGWKGFINLAKDGWKGFTTLAKGGWNSVQKGFSIFSKGYGRAIAQGSGKIGAMSRGSSGLLNAITKGGFSKAAGSSAAIGVTKTASVLSKVLAPLSLLIGGITGALEAKEARRTTVEGAVLGALTGGAKTGSMFSGVLGVDKGSNTDKALGVAGGAAWGASAGAAIGAVFFGAGAAPGALIGALVGAGFELLKIVTEGTTLLGDLISGIISPITLFTDIIWSAVSGIGNILKGILTFNVGTIFKGVSDIILAIPKALYNMVGSILKGIISIPKIYFQYISMFASGMVSIFKNAISIIGSALMSTLIDFPIWFARSIMDGIKSVLFDLPNWLIGVVDSGFDSIMKTEWMQPIIAPFKEIWDIMKDIIYSIVQPFQEAWSTINSALEPLLQAWDNIRTAIFGVSEPASFAATILKTLATGIGFFIKMALIPVKLGFQALAYVVKGVMSVVSPVIEILTGFFVMFAQGMTSMVNYAVNSFKFLRENITSVVGGIIGAIFSPFTWLYNVLKGVASGIVGIIVSPFELFHSILVGLTSVVGGIAAPFEYFYNTLVDLWGWLSNLNPLSWWSSSKETKKINTVSTDVVLEANRAAIPMPSSVEKVAPVKSLEEQFAIGKELGRTCDTITESRLTLEKNLKTESAYVERGAFESNLSQEALSAGMSTEYLSAGVGVESLDISSILSGLASGIYNVIVAPFKLLGGFISGMIDVIITPYKMLYNVLKGIADFIIGGLVTTFKMLYNNLKNIGSFIISGLIAPFKLLYNVLKVVGNFIFDVLIAPYKMLYNVLKGVANFIIGGLVTTFKMLYNIASSVINVLKGVGNFIIGGLIAPFKLLYNVLKVVGNFIFDVLMAPFNMLYNIFVGLTSVVSGIMAPLEYFYNTLVDLWDWIGKLNPLSWWSSSKETKKSLKTESAYVGRGAFESNSNLSQEALSSSMVTNIEKVTPVKSLEEQFAIGKELGRTCDTITESNSILEKSVKTESAYVGRGAFESNSNLSQDALGVNAVTNTNIEKSVKTESAYVGRGAFESNSNLSQDALGVSAVTNSNTNIDKVASVKSLEKQITESNLILEKNLKTDSSYVGLGAFESNSSLSQEALSADMVSTNIEKVTPVKSLEKQFSMNTKSILEKNLKTESSYVGRGAFESNSGLSQEALNSSITQLDRGIIRGQNEGKVFPTNVLQVKKDQLVWQKAELEKNTNNLQKVDSSYVGRGAFESNSNLSQEALSSSMSSILQVLDPLNIGGMISSFFVKKEQPKRQLEPMNAWQVKKAEIARQKAELERKTNGLPNGKYNFVHGERQTNDLQKVDSSYVGRGAFESNSNLSQEALSSSMSSSMSSIVQSVLDPLNVGGMISNLFVKKEPLKGESGYVGRGAFDSGLMQDVSFDTQMIKSATIEDQFNQSKSSTSMINTGAFGERSVSETKDYDNLQAKMASMASMDYNNVFESIRSEIASKPQGGATRALYITDNGTDEEIDNSTLASNGSGNVDRELFKSFMTTTTNRGVSVGAGMFTPEDAADYVMQQMAGTMPTTSASIAGMEHLTQLAEERNSTLAQILAEMKIANSKNVSSNSVNAFFGGSDKKSTEGKSPITRYKKEILRGNYVDMAAIAANHQDNLATLPR